MARITVEDCLEFVPNRFELVLLGARRARDLGAGADPMVRWDRDKRGVIALRELGTGRLDPAEVRESLVRSFQRYADEDRPPEDESEPSPAFGVVAGTTGDGGDEAPLTAFRKG